MLEGEARVWASAEKDRLASAPIPSIALDSLARRLAAILPVHLPVICISR